MPAGITWVIEASESQVIQPVFLYGVSAGRCYFLWSDEFGSAKKFDSAHEAAYWAASNRLNCGFRIREYGAKIERRGSTK